MRNPSSKLPHGVRRLFRLPTTAERALREVDEEMRFHFAMRVDELRALGMSAEDAIAEAAHRFGDLEQYRVHVARRAARNARWYSRTDLRGFLERVCSDLRFALRQFIRAPAFALGIVLILCLGI